MPFLNNNLKNKKNGHFINNLSEKAKFIRENSEKENSYKEELLVKKKEEEKNSENKLPFNLQQTEENLGLVIFYNYDHYIYKTS